MSERIKFLELRARALAPRWVRTAYRFGRSLGSQPISQPLPAHLVRDCRCCASRVEMLDLLPKNAVVAEVGTCEGWYARHIVERTQPRELHLIDMDFTRFDPTGLTGEAVQRHEGLTVDKLSMFPDEYFDWIYIDADHSYAGALGDAQASAAKLKPGGYLAFNDFCHIDLALGRYGVHRAVTDFMLDHQWPIKIFAFSEWAQYDVVLQKPE